MIKNIFVILVFIILSASSIESFAADWKLVAYSDENNVNTFVDTESIINNGDIYNFWMFHDFKGNSEYEGKKIQKTTAYTVVNCDTRTINYKEIIVEWTDGKTQKSNPSLKEEPVKEGTVSEGVLNYICEK